MTATAELGEPILEVDNLSVAFRTETATIRAVDEVNIKVAAGDIYALVGESGCGKSTLAYSLLDIVPPPGKVVGGRVRFRGQELGSMDSGALNHLRASQLSMVFQAAMNAFNPVLTIERQVGHILAAHRDVFESEEKGKKHFEDLLDMVRLPKERILSSFESQLSGGMKQRVAIAVALLLNPSVLILDEPTTALDVLNQRLIIDILRDLHDSLGVTIIFVTHDLAVVAELATRVGVMYAGRLVEEGKVQEIFAGEHRHPYVAALIDAIPSVAADKALARSIPGTVPNLAELPPGCRFAPRCGRVVPHCREVEPRLIADDRLHRIACHVANDDVPAEQEAHA
ncbi:MAG TPA: ABC transporter ATP-binding protein [Mycobacteriales bacterium]|jgi:peptide/nickel transport system ATP-binding protein|nr:ABC transporter ATP-binding protein [Mycobacteriales bacterium]